MFQDMYSYVMRELSHRDLPNDDSLQTIVALREAIDTNFEEGLHLPLLVELLRLSQPEQEFVRQGECWEDIGFQRDDPVSDIRGGGILSLVNMIYFLEHYNEAAQGMIERSRNRTDGKYYPWAAAGINLTKLLAVHFEVVLKSGSTTGINHSLSTKWMLLPNVNSFHRLYCSLFCLLDSVYQEMDAGYMDFPRVLEVTKKRFEKVLSRAINVDDVEVLVKQRQDISPRPSPSHSLTQTWSRDTNNGGF